MTNSFKRVCTRILIAFTLVISLVPIPQAVCQAAVTYFSVGNTNDSGLGSLRWAILSANTNPVADEIRFAIPTSDPGYNPTTGVFTISLSATLTLSGDDTTIDGSTQTTAIGITNPDGLEIEVDGVDRTFPVFTITSNNNFLEYLTIVRGSQGVELLDDADGNHIYSNNIGTDADGVYAKPNTNGIYIHGGSDSNHLFDNYISGNINNGVWITDSNGNLIGTNWIGTNEYDVDLGNGAEGVFISGTSSANQIGTLTGTAVIGFNGGNGVHLQAASENTIEYCAIGVNRYGSGNLGNSGSGVLVDGGGTDNSITGSVISNNASHGVYVSGVGTDRTVIASNYIGTDNTGNVALGNSEHGIAIYDGATDTYVVENLILASGWSGLVFHNSDLNSTYRNRIGTGVDPYILTLGNTYYGIHIEGSNNTIVEDTIALNGLATASDGVRVDGLNHTATGNHITRVSIYLNGGKGIENINGGNGDLLGPSIDPSSTCTHIKGYTQLANSTVELYTGPGNQGMHYLGAVTSGADGYFEWTGYAFGDYVSATWVVDPRNTSEFSALDLPTCHLSYLPVTVKP